MPASPTPTNDQKIDAFIALVAKREKNNMKILEDSSAFYNEVINFIDLGNYEYAIKYIRKYTNTLKTPDDIALAYLNCAFLNDKVGNNHAAIDYFSKTISLEDKLDHDLGEFFASKIDDFLNMHALTHDEIVAIGSHGQTIKHEPNSLKPFDFWLIFFGGF